VLWLPNLDVGSAYIRHSGGTQGVAGNLLVESTNSLISGGGAILRVGTADAIFEPLAARQVLAARRIDTQTARNEALEVTAEAYFNVQFARGTYGAMTDATAKAVDVVRRVESLARGLVAPDEIDRARTLLAELEQSSQVARQQWRVSSANLTRVLRLDPSAVVIPLEPDHLQVSLIAPEWPVDDLIVVGLMNRPELASNRAVVRANVIRLRKERIRPFVPSILVTGNGTPDFYFQGGIFGTGANGNLNQWAGRGDVAAQAVWQLDNLGFGYQAKVREQEGETRLANIELFNVQDRVAAEVAQAKADVDSATLRVVQAENGLQQGLTSFRGNLIGMGQTQRFNDILTLVNRPQEVVASLQQLQQAYVNYYRTVAEFNRAQFRLFYALGFPAEVLACQRPPGAIEPVDTYRGPALPNVR
jgi:outer membrane protein TolC